MHQGVSLVVTYRKEVDRGVVDVLREVMAAGNNVMKTGPKSDSGRQMCIGLPDDEEARGSFDQAGCVTAWEGPLEKEKGCVSKHDTLEMERTKNMEEDRQRVDANPKEVRRDISKTD
ncbi:hypothetical protein SERLADRAFT_477347 [Serpula lacrymans var. lacrymans S7.9]|uniref:Uncharacterized protein n=1 Tax=Serpula lacrymans var. lacrymans (strain S7.9) TaxID=578457 RepID=F8P8V4_SERL9|nr:uncharacterized protein SERLADRAFT_477347 [Serpula lacrymans var. lacrymans S7.9]EGO20860.1 hypothetical protein SERLADRAFT_477347 [Serpula lacrymans var. lacrymans S7.9]